MANTDIIRTIIQDTPLYQMEQITVDGVQTSLQLFYFPVIGSTVTITGSDVPSVLSIDEYNGVIVFTSAPDAQVVTITYNHVNLLDSDLLTFIAIESDPDGSFDIRLAAADALDAIARSQALIQKKIKLLDLETDGPSLAKELRASAQSLREQVLQKDMQESTFDIIEQINIEDSSAFREKIIKDWMRENG